MNELEKIYARFVTTPLQDIYDRVVCAGAPMGNKNAAGHGIKKSDLHGLEIVHHESGNSTIIGHKFYGTALEHAEVLSDKYPHLKFSPQGEHTAEPKHIRVFHKDPSRFA